MVRIRGLGQTLSRVIGKASVREISGDANEGPQRQRPTASARRQRETAFVAEDVEHLDHAADKVHEQPEEATADDVVTDAEGFLGGPYDILVLMDYVHHMAMIVWNGEVFIFLNK